MPMTFRQLGRAGARVSPLCLGTMTFGEADANSFMHQVGCDEATSFEIMDRALDAGINFFDSADVYGQDGLSERVVGRYFARSGRRDEVVLATKFRFRMERGTNGSGAARLRVMRACDDSLRRLGTDRIDLYQIHLQDLDVPEDELLRALDDLVRAGKVHYIGCSNYTAWRLMESLWTSDRLGLERFVTMQMQYSMVVRDLEREHVPIAQRFGVGILPWSPLAAGFLSGKYDEHAPPAPGTRLERWKERMGLYGTESGWRTLAAVKAVAAELGSTPAAVSLAWLMGKPGVTSVIFGARTMAQLEANLAATALVLPAEALAKLEAASALAAGYPYDFIARIQGRWG